MAQYQRFLSYLFEYEGDQKKENCGFAKIEIRGDVQRIFLSVKNNEQAEILHVFGFYHTKRRCIMDGCIFFLYGIGYFLLLNRISCRSRK